MSLRRSNLRVAVVAGAVIIAGCSSESASPPSDADTEESAPTATATAPAVDGAAPSLTDPPSTLDPPSTPATSEPAGGGSTLGDVPPPTLPTSTAPMTATTGPSQVSEEADELVLSDSFADGGDTWEEEGSWDVDVPGEASAVVIDGVGVMETDRQGTHEWVRAIAEGSVHDDAILSARITPRRSDEGTVFIGLRGDGEWRDAFQYLPQTGVVLEYGYSPIFEGEVVLIVLDGGEQRRIGPVQGPVLVDGESAEIRFAVEGDRARAKVWRAGDDEPADWQIEADTTSSGSGMVQLSYRDRTAQSVAWDELTLLVLPADRSG